MSKEYTLKSFQDVIDKVPTNRIRDCMAELAELIIQTKAAGELILKTAAHIAKEKGKEFPAITELPAGSLQLPKEFTWVDDGKGEVVSILKTDAIKPEQTLVEIHQNLNSGEFVLK